MLPVQTMTITGQQPVVLRLRPDLRRKPALERLVEIVDGIGNETWKKWGDPVSALLLDWCDSVIPIDLSKITDEKGFEHIALLRCQELVTGILTDDVGGYLDKEPVYVEEMKWICEKEWISQCNYMGKKFTLHPHPFAKAMIEWAKSLTEIVKPEAEEGVLVNVTRTIQDDERMESIRRSFLMTYQMTVNNKCMFAQMQAFVKQQLDESKRFKDKMAEIEKQSKARIEEALRQAEISKKELNDRLSAIAQASGERLEVLQGQANVLRTQINEREAQLLKLQEESRHNAAAIAQLRYQYQLRCQELEALRNSKGKRWYECSVM